HRGDAVTGQFHDHAGRCWRPNTLSHSPVREAGTREHCSSQSRDRRSRHETQRSGPGARSRSPQLAPPMAVVWKPQNLYIQPLGHKSAKTASFAWTPESIKLPHLSEAIFLGT